MGHIQFMNQDGEWETYPDDMQEVNFRQNAKALESMGYKLICDQCDALPTMAMIRQRYLKDEWICESCGAKNSAEKA